MLNSILGPIARDGLKKRDRVYVGNFVTIPLEPGEERVASWMVRDVPEGVSWYKANAAVAGNLILTSKRLLFEPHVPPMMAYGAHGKKTGFNLLQRSNTRGHRYEPLAVELADVRSVEADHVDDLQGAGAPVKIVMEDGGERRLRIVRELPAPAPRAGVGEQARPRFSSSRRPWSTRSASAGPRDASTRASCGPSTRRSVSSLGSELAARRGLRRGGDGFRRGDQGAGRRRRRRVGCQKSGPTCKSAFFGSVHRILTPHRCSLAHTAMRTT